MSAAPNQTTTPAQIVDLQVRTLVVTEYANLPGGSGSGTAKGFQYTATGAENPAGFVVPIAGLPASYVANCQPLVRVAGGLALAAVIAQTAISVTVATAVQPAAGDTLNIVAAST